MSRPEYKTAEYQHAKRMLKGKRCVTCGAKADTVEHYPPISAFPPGRWRGNYYPMCGRCNYSRGGAIGAKKTNAKRKLAKKRRQQQGRRR